MKKLTPAQKAFLLTLGPGFCQGMEYMLEPIDLNDLVTRGHLRQVYGRRYELLSYSALTPHVREHVLSLTVESSSLGDKRTFVTFAGPIAPYLVRRARALMDDIRSALRESEKTLA